MSDSLNSEVMEFVNCNLCGSNSVINFMKVNGFNIVKCKKCGLAYVNPRLKEKKLHEIYNKEYFENPALTGSNASFCGYGEYLEEKANIQATFSKRLKTIDKFSEKGRLLDIGCAFGFFLELAKEDGWDAKGLEISNHAYKYAKGKLKLHVINQTLEKAGFKSNSFDVVVLFDVIEHLQDPKSSLKEVRRILKPNGLLVITTPDIGSITAKVLWKNWEEVKRVREHIYFFSKDTLKKLLKSLNFKILKTESAGRFFSVESAINRGKLYNKAIFTVIGKLADTLRLKKKNIYVDPHYKITVYARKA